MEWVQLLAAFAALEPWQMRHPEDIGRRIPGALALSYQLAGEGLLYRSPATLYCRITDTGRAMLAAMEGKKAS